MKEELTRLKEHWLEQKRSIVNPDNIETWEEFGFDGKPDKYNSVDEYLDSEEGFFDAEYDEGDQVSLRLIGEFLEGIEKMLGKC